MLAAAAAALSVLEAAVAAVVASVVLIGIGVAVVVSVVFVLVGIGSCSCGCYYRSPFRWKLLQLLPVSSLLVFSWSPVSSSFSLVSAVAEVVVRWLGDCRQW